MSIAEILAIFFCATTVIGWLCCFLKSCVADMRQQTIDHLCRHNKALLDTAEYWKARAEEAEDRRDDDERASDAHDFIHFALLPCLLAARKLGLKRKPLLKRSTALVLVGRKQRREQVHNAKD